MSETKKCSQCGRDRMLTYFTKDKLRAGGRGIYCHDCRRAQYLAKRDAGRLTGGEMRVCASCGQLFNPKTKAQRYCSRTCARHLRRLPSRHCEACNTEFQPGAAVQRFCCYACKAAGMTVPVGSRRLGDGGYVLVRVPKGTPGAQGDRAWMPEHRYVMQEHLGRPLRPDETVHHINGVKDDNRIENLQVRQGRHGKGVVMTCLDCGSHNVAPRPLAVERDSG